MHLAEVFVRAGEVLVDGHGGGVEELDGGLLADAGQAEQLAPGTEPQAVYLRRQVQDSLVRPGLGRPAGKNENKIQQKSKIKSFIKLNVIFFLIGRPKIPLKQLFK